ncbi:hypothetical protein GMMP13_170023 [Candidatus Magnetomoraceae bacterium gMMP-13]
MNKKIFFACVILITYLVVLIFFMIGEKKDNNDPTTESLSSESTVQEELLIEPEPVDFQTKELTVGISELPLNFNPFMARRYIEKIISNLIYAPLIGLKYNTVDPKKSFQPVLAENIRADKNNRGIIHISLKNNIPIHNKPGSIGIEDIKYTLEGISRIPTNSYNRNKIRILDRENKLDIQVDYPPVGKGKEELLRRYLTFPVVPDKAFRSFDEQVDTDIEIKEKIKGPGPYELEEYDNNNNKIIMQRFNEYIGHNSENENSIFNIVFNFRDKYGDIITSFKDGKFHILLDYFGEPLTALTGSSNYVRKPDPTLNSFTCLAFNFRQNKFRDLIYSNNFREIVAACMDDSNVRDIFNEYPGKSMHLIDEPLNRYIKKDVYKHDIKIKEKKLKDRITMLFKDERLKKYKYKQIRIYYESFKPVYERLAGKAAKSLNKAFRGYLEFKAVPVPSPNQWFDLTFSTRNFTMVLYTHYFGVNRVIMNTEFFKNNNQINLTGKRISLRKNKYGEIDYDNFLLKVNSDLPVVVIGMFYRYNIINSQDIIAPWNDPEIDPDEQEALKNSPLFYKVWDWKWKK